MADTEISDLTADATPGLDSLVVTVDDPAGTPATRKSTLQNVKTLFETTPQWSGMVDVNGQAIGDGTRELLTFTEDASAVNHVNIENQATGGGPIISAAGDDTNIDLQLAGKGTGKVKIGTDEVAVVASGGDLSAFTGLLGLNSGTAVDVDTKDELDTRISATLVQGSGTIDANDYAKFSDGDTVVGRTYAEVRTDLGLVIGTDVQAYDADTLKADTADTLTAGFDASDHAAGTKSTGTYTPAAADGNFQVATNGGAHTLAPPSTSCCIVVHYTNNGTAGTITTSGFSIVTGDAFTTTDTHEFICHITKINDVSALHVTALQ